MRYRFMAALAALVVAFGLGLAPAAQAQAIGHQARPVAAPPAGGVIADDFSTRPVAGNQRLAPIAPPRKYPGDASHQARLLTTDYYHYNVGQDDTNSNSPVPQGVAYNATIHSCNVDTADGAYHSLGQIAVREITSGTHYVELGWACNPGVFGDTNPHLFSSIWLNGAWCGSFTGSGTCTGIPYTDNAANATNLGASLAGAIGTSKTFKVIHSGGYWWVYYDSTSNWIGRFQTGQPGGWPSTFNEIRLVQIYGEVATTQDPMTTDCTDMGSGVLGDASPAAGAQFGSATYFDSTGAGLPTTDVNLTVSQYSSPGTYPGATAYNAEAQSTRTFRYGGPGVC